MRNAQFGKKERERTIFTRVGVAEFLVRKLQIAN